jgi:acyl-CoA synthetase (AMP-forming)/AMP-acid ligase II
VDGTIPAALAAAERDFGGALALAEPDGARLTYAELAVQSGTVARALIAAGIDPGDRVAIWSPNTSHWVLAALGALSAGAVLVPVSTRLTGPEALDVISHSGARALLVADWFLGRDRLAGLRVAARAAAASGGAGPDDPDPLDQLSLVVRIPVDPPPPGLGLTPGISGPTTWPPEHSTRASPAPADPGPGPGSVVSWAELPDLAAIVAPRLAGARATSVLPSDVSDILFTSGTTGRSKGAMSAHRQALAVAGAWASCAHLRPADRYLVVSPFSHSFGYKAGILACLVSGAALIPQPAWDAEQAMHLVASERITVLPGAPAIYQAILDHPHRGRYDLSTLRLAVTGAATVPVALVERIMTDLCFDTVLTAYGLTEAVVVTMCRPGDSAQTVARTSGRPTAGFEVQVTGPGGRAVAAGESGEIWLRGPNVMLGYLDDPAATAAAIDAAGWLHTGDIGSLDAAGNLAISGRLTDMYICGGFNVYPAEVEQVLARLDGVAESAVIGVPDRRLGEVGVAFVVPRPGHVLDEAGVLAFCRARLAGYKVPRQVRFRDSLPRSPSGKPLKRLLREEPP